MNEKDVGEVQKIECGHLATRRGQPQLNWESWAEKPNIIGEKYMARCPEKGITVGPCFSVQAAVIALGMEVDREIEREERDKG